MNNFTFWSLEALKNKMHSLFPPHSIRAAEDSGGEAVLRLPVALPHLCFS